MQQLDTFIKSAVIKMEGGNISRGGNGIGGLAIGYMQNDCSTNKNARADFRAIMEVEKGKKINGQYIDDPYIDKIVDDAKKSKISDAEYAVASYAVNDNNPKIQTILDGLNNEALARVNLRVEQAFQAAESNPNGPGELNRVAPNPQLLAEVAAWANQTGYDLWGTVLEYLSGKNEPGGRKISGTPYFTVKVAGASQISQANFQTDYLYKQRLFTTVNPKTGKCNFKEAWLPRITDATEYAKSEIGALVVPVASLNGVVTTANANSAGPNYLSLSGNLGGYLWTFCNTSATGPNAGGIDVSMNGTDVGTFKQGDWSNLSVSGGNLTVNSPVLKLEGSPLEPTVGTKITVYSCANGKCKILSTDTDPNFWDQKTDMSGDAAATDTTYKKYDAGGTLLSSAEDKIDASGNRTITDNTYDASGALSSSSVEQIDASGNMSRTDNKYAGGTLLSSATETQTDAGGVITDTYSGVNSTNGDALSDTETAQAGSVSMTYGAVEIYGDGSVSTSAYDASTGVYKIDSKHDGYPQYANFVHDFTITPNAGGGYTETWTGPSAAWSDQDPDNDPQGTGLQTGTYNTSTGAYTESIDGVDVTPTSPPSWDPSLPFPTVTTGTNTTSTYNPRTSISTSITYDGNGGYTESWSKYVDDCWGENDKSADGSYYNYTQNANGTYTWENYNASTGITTDGSGGDGYQDVWYANDGSYGADDVLANGNYTDTTNNPDGSVITNTYDAASGVNEEDQKKADGSYAYITRNANGSLIQSTFDASTNTTAISTFDADGDLTYEDSTTKNSDGSVIQSSFDASSNKTAISMFDAEGNATYADWTIKNSDGSNNFIDGGIVIRLRDKLKCSYAWRYKTQKETFRRAA